QGIADSAAAMYFERDYALPEPIKAIAKWPPLQEIVGRYSMGTFPPFTITIRGGKPFLSWNPVRVSALVPIAEDTWFEKFDWLTLKAERDATGKITGFTGTAPWSNGAMKATRIE
ncbi:MAG: hypothetical protein ACXW31_09975, partial [Thermoanaerobaculia bacterium]